MRSIRGRWRGISLTALVVLVASLTAVAPSYAGGQGQPPDAPVQSDKCGTYQDSYTIPDDESKDYVVSGRLVEPGIHLLPAGQKSITIDAYDPWQNGDPQVGNWTFNYTDLACPAQALNQLSVNMGDCLQNYNRAVSVVYTNVADGSDLTATGLQINVVRIADKDTAYAWQTPLPDVPDGQSSIPLALGNVVDPSSPVSIRSGDGLSTGTWLVRASADGVPKVTMYVTVQSCGNSAPENDPMNYGGTSGALRRFGQGQVRAKLATPTVPSGSVATFELVRITRHRVRGAHRLGTRRATRTYTVAGDSIATRLWRARHPASTFILKVLVNGHWKTLATKLVRE